MTIAILGCGPAGLLAAHAAQQRDIPYIVYSIREPSKIHGAQFLHEDIPGLTPEEPDGMVTFEFRGTKEGYAKKVYGDSSIDVSWDRYSGEVPAWDLRTLYDAMWRTHYDNIFDVEIRGEFIQKLLRDEDLILSTINPLGYCQHQDDLSHTFSVQPIQVYQTSFIEIDDNTVVYSGDPADTWMRCSRLFDDLSAECPGGSVMLPGERIARVNKPLFTDCDCYMEENFHRLGRYGEFKRGLLVNDAFHKAEGLLDEML